MRLIGKIALAAFVSSLSISTAYAACEGTNGRGWGSGKGAGKFTMNTTDKSCQITFPSFINDAQKTRIPATQTTVTKQPKSGAVSVNGKGPVYTPNAGFKGRDQFCTSNTSPKVKGKKLSGCITVTVK